MKLLRPFTVTDTNLTSNVPEVGTYPEYSAAASYALGDIVISTSGSNPTHRMYESLVAGNTGNALTDASKWLDLGPTNRWAMFDTVNSTGTTGSAGIDVSVAVTGRADGVALLGLDAQSVQVTMTAGAFGTVYDETFSLQSNSGISSWFEYFSEEPVYLTDLVVTDMPLYTDPVIRVQITAGGGAVTCGTMVLGQIRNIGASLYGAKSGIQDYSRKETDDFGNTTFVERAYAKRSTFKVVCENAQIDALFALLTNVRAVPCVWLGSDQYAMTWIFGWARDWAKEITYPSHSHLSIEIEGLT